MSILNSLIDGSYNSDGFKKILEDHLSIIKSNTNTIEVAPIDANRFEYDLFSVLRELKIDPKLHWIIMRVNGMNSPADYKKEMLQLQIPDEDYFDSLLATYNSSQVKNLT